MPESLHRLIYSAINCTDRRELSVDFKLPQYSFPKVRNLFFGNRTQRLTSMRNCDKSTSSAKLLVLTEQVMQCQIRESLCNNLTIASKRKRGRKNIFPDHVFLTQASIAFLFTIKFENISWFTFQGVAYLLQSSEVNA